MSLERQLQLELARRGIGTYYIPHSILSDVASELEKHLSNDVFSKDELKMETWDLDPLKLQEQIKKIHEERNEKTLVLNQQQQDLRERLREVEEESHKVFSDAETKVWKLERDAVEATTAGIMEIIKEIPTVKTSMEKRKRADEREEEYKCKRKKLLDERATLDKEYADVSRPLYM